MRSQPLAFPPPSLPLPPPLPSSSSSSSSSFHSSRPAMGLFHPSPPGAHHQPPSSARSAGTAAPPPSRAAAILASQAIKKDAGGSGAAAGAAGAAAAAASSTGTHSGSGAGSGAATSLASTAGSSRRTSAAAKDTKRRATHSQIERRRREKINDRLITLRNLVPACNEEIAARQRLEGGGGEASQPANAASPTEAGGAEEIGSGPGAKRKRKRTRRKVVEELKDKEKDKDAEPELGMHKLDVLTHTIEFIYQLQARIQELETGKRPVKVQRAERDDTVDEAMQGNTSSPPPTAPPAAAPAGTTNLPSALPPIEEKHPRGFTPIKLGGSYRRDLGHMRSMSASSETTSEADLPLNHQLPTPGYSIGFGYGSGYGHGYGYAYDSSPSFTTGASSSSSKGANTPASSGALSGLTRPFMSLSASSPIFLAGTSSGGGGGGGAGKKGSLDTRGQAPSFALPPAALSLYEVGHHHHQHSHQHHGEVRGQHGSTSSVRNGGSQEEEDGQEREDHEMAAAKHSNGSNGRNVTGRSPKPELEPEASSAARLLLAMSASPEDALRPIGGGSHHFDPRTNGTIPTVPTPAPAPLSMPRMRRSTTTSFHVDRPEMSKGSSGIFFAQQPYLSANGPPTAAQAHTHSQYRRWAPGSAPGGSRATTTTATATGGGATTGRMGPLPSPPLLALDDQAVQE